MPKLARGNTSLQCIRGTSVFFNFAGIEKFGDVSSCCDPGRGLPASVAACPELRG